MSIKAYIGRMGSGKTYEVVTSVILAALARGRRVISNIAGLNYDEFVAVLVEDGVPLEQIGKLVQVSHDDVMRPEFWMTDKDNVADRIKGLVDLKTGECFECIIPGDLVSLDENWRFWEGFAARNMPERVMNCFRMHRHFAHSETGVSCDFALISQDVMDFSRKVRAVIEETYYMEKLTAVGSSKRYRIDVHQGGKVGRKPLLQMQRSYDPRYFPLYSSHSLKQEGAANAKEENIDGRGNILNGAIFKLGLPVAAVVFFLAGWGVYRFFNPSKPVDDVSLEVVDYKGAAGLPPAAPSPGAKVTSAISQAWRVVGHWQTGTSFRVAVVDASGNLRLLVDPPAYKLTSLGLEVQLPEGDFATSWTLMHKAGQGVLP